MSGRNDIHIRLGEARDTEALRTCAQAAYAHYIERIGREPPPMAETFDDPIAETRVHVIEIDGDVVGYLVTAQRSDALLVENLAVLPGHQGLGLGSRLMSHAEDVARASGFEAVELFTHVTMRENVVYYGKRGYEVIDRREDEGLQRVFMRKALD